jgi:acyl-CoA thioester hydrolase
MTFSATHVVRTYECDGYGHVNNAVYLNYLEYARREFLTAIGFDYRGFLDAGYLIFVTHIDIRYKAAAFQDDKLFIGVEPITLKKVSGTFIQTVHKEDGTLCVHAEVTWACVNKSSVPRAIPEAFLVPGLYPEIPADSKPKVKPQ